MKTFIVFDLEWNQSPNGKDSSVGACPFEIIEIGAVKLDQQCQVIDEFHRLIRPQIYQEMHFMISEVTHMDMQELHDCGDDFVTAMNAFIKWCSSDSLPAAKPGEEHEPVFCTWGSQDLTELQRNLTYYGMDNPFPQPLFYYDVQKLYGLFKANGRKPSLDAAISELGLPQERPFHRALDDAYYTSMVMQQFDLEQVSPYVSIDYYWLPERKADHVRLIFPDYAKEVTRIFPSKEDALEDKGVLEMKCYCCGRTLRKKVRWFAANQRVWYGLALCPEHGYLKGKIRIKKVDDTRVYVVKTLKLTDEEGAQGIRDRKTGVQQKRAQRNHAKKRKKS